ncbi:JAB domain-containing protein [Candidatus Darwinibacter acetoxidans]
MSTALQQYIVPRYRLALVREGEHPAMFPAACTCTEKAQLICEEYFRGLDREHLIMLALDAKNGIIGFHTVSIGTLDSSLCHPREIFKAAFLMNAARIILAHNHPSGDPTPSDGDIILTKRLVKAGILLGVPVLDHIIVGEYRSVSLAEYGYIREEET